MTPEERQKIIDEALAPYLETIEYERDQAKYWFESSMSLSTRYNELLIRQQKMIDEQRELYKKLLGLE